MSRKVLGYSILIAALLLSVAGVAYAHWTKVITVDGYVISGSVDWCWKTIEVTEGVRGTDRTGDIWETALGYDYWYMDTYKDIAQVWYEIDAEDCKLAYFGIDKAYPSYFANVRMYPKVTGTVPVKINNIELWLIPYPDAPQGEWILVDDALRNEYAMLDWDDDGECDVELAFGEAYLGQQLEPDGELELSFYLHVCEDVDFTHYMSEVRNEYQFALRLVCVNYNEYPIEVQPPA